VQAQETTNFALLSLFNILFAGVAFVLYGLAAATSQVYPRWLGRVVMVAGVGGLAAGSIQAYVGKSTPITVAMGIIAPTVITRVGHGLEGSATMTQSTMHPPPRRQPSAASTSGSWTPGTAAAARTWPRSSPRR
jgi:hypothetical protein